MRRSVLLVVLGVAVVSASSGLFASDVDIKGVTPGKWTMDLEAAGKLAGEKALPILVNFTGSDWCGWCKLMEKEVFSQRDWQDYAKNNILMVIVDFPQDSEIVPQEYVERNEKLRDKYAVEGFPTFVILDDDAETELGRLGAGQKNTPAAFISDLTQLFRYRAADVARYADTLKPEDKSAYLNIVGRISECSSDIKRHKKQISEAEQNMAEAEQKIADLKSSAREFRAAQLGPDKLKEFNKLNADLEVARKKIEDWMSTDPEPSQKNQKLFETMNSAVQELSRKLSMY